MKKRIIYLPIEVKPRELLGRLFLGASAVARGWQVHIGRERELRKALLDGPPGALIEINIPEPKAEELQTYHARGHKIANLCEESIVYYGGRDYCQRKIGPTSVQHVEVLLVVGRRNEGDLHLYRPDSASKTRVTGNPRFDTLMTGQRSVFTARAEPVRERFGRFLLVNTNFGPVNHVKRSSDEILSSLEKMRLIENDEHRAMLRRWHNYKRGQLEALRQLLSTVAKSRRYDNIVVRPHPTENHDTWRAWADPLGIKVQFQDSASVWMLAAAAMLHTGCTTAIEAVLLDLPVTSFVPQPGHEMLNQADEISEQISTAEEFIASSDRAESDPDFVDRRRVGLHAAVSEIVANTEPPASAERILDVLDSLDLPEVELQSRRGGTLSAAWHTIQTMTRRRNSYAYRKFDGLGREEIVEPLTDWVHSGALPHVPEVERYPDGTWLLT